jgi:hypothetical protein
VSANHRVNNTYFPLKEYPGYLIIILRPVFALDKMAQIPSLSVSARIIISKLNIEFAITSGAADGSMLNPV